MATKAYTNKGMVLLLACAAQFMVVLEQIELEPAPSHVSIVPEPTGTTANLTIGSLDDERHRSAGGVPAGQPDCVRGRATHEDEQVSGHAQSGQHRSRFGLRSARMGV